MVHPYYAYHSIKWRMLRFWHNPVSIDSSILKTYYSLYKRNAPNNTNNFMVLPMRVEWYRNQRSLQSTIIPKSCRHGPLPNSMTPSLLPFITLLIAGIIIHKHHLYIICTILQYRHWSLMHKTIRSLTILSGQRTIRWNMVVRYPSK